MNREVIVDETVDTLVRLMPDGQIRPTSFLWRSRTRYVGETGRTWEERVGGRTLRCYLIKDVADNTFELRWDVAADEWMIHRAWLNEAIA